LSLFAISATVTNLTWIMDNVQRHTCCFRAIFQKTGVSQLPCWISFSSCLGLVLSFGADQSLSCPLFTFYTVGWAAQVGRPACKKWGDGGGGLWLVRMEWSVMPSRMVIVSASVNLPLHHKVQKWWSRKKGRKTVVCGGFTCIPSYFNQSCLLPHQMGTLLTYCLSIWTLCLLNPFCCLTELQ